MAERGDVLRLKRRLGFGKDRAGEHVVVVQRFAPGRVGRLSPRTLATLESRLRLVLDL